MGPIGNHWFVPENLPIDRWEGGELLAWRVWRLVCGPDRELRLASISHGTVWDSPVLTADHRPIAIPSDGSGIYALKPRFRPARGQFNWGMGADTWVRGWVALSGRVIEHRYGYRAERVVIRRLRLGAAAHRFLRTSEALVAVQHELERRYQCRVKITGVDARIARGFVSPVPLPTTPTSIPLTPLAAPAPQVTRQGIRVGPPRRAKPSVVKPRGMSPDGIKYDAVRRVFAQAQGALGKKWHLYGRGHCERVTLKAHYCRHARLAAPESVAYFSPSGSIGRCYVFPAALVRRAASILRVDPDVFIARSL